MSSSYYTVGHVLELLHLNAPYQKIVDIGSGFGKYATLIRDFFEENPHIPSTWRIQLDAIEINEEYITGNYSFYTNLFCADLMNVEISDYDLVLFIDVLEHLEKSQAREMMKRVQGHVIIVTTNGFHEQETLHSNPFQKHRCGFTKKELKQMGFRVIKIRDELIAHNMKYSRKPIKHKLIPLQVRRLLRHVRKQ